MNGFIIMGIFTLVFLLIVLYITKVVNVKYEIKKYLDEIMEDKNLPIIESLDFLRDRKVHIYDLKYKNRKLGILDIEDERYIKLIEMLSRSIKLDIVDDGTGQAQLDIELKDFTLPENEAEYLDIIEMFTNFKISSFVFKGDRRFKLLGEDSKIINKMKENADRIIAIVFNKIVESLEHSLENGDDTMLNELLSSEE